MKLNRIMLAAPGSGSGKTMLTCALLMALKRKGHRPVAYKCGPDYIDPMFHKKVIDIPSKNLDTFFTGEEKTRELFLKHRREDEFAVIEGVMGLYDGIRGIWEEGSSYHLAKVTHTPILLVVDAKGMGRSVIPLIKGFLLYDTEHLIKGVILNRMSGAYYESIRPWIEAECGISVMGYFPEKKELRIESRHLGLVLPEELADIRERVAAAAEELVKTVSLEKIVHAAEMAEELAVSESGTQAEPDAIEEHRPVLAVARDEAFCFYYEDNLELLRECGADIRYFSPLHDDRLPEGLCGLLLGGGYPELHAAALCENKEMLSQIRRAVEDGMPVVAECGGFLYLHAMLEDREGQSHAMAAAIDAACHDTGRLVRFGYVEIEEKESSFLGPGERIKGHEFHYFDSEENGSDCVAHKPYSERSYPCIIADENRWLGFPHLYYPSNETFARSLVEKARAYRERKEASDGKFTPVF